MLEQLIKDLIATLEANTAAHLGKSGAAASSTKSTAAAEEKAEEKKTTRGARGASKAKAVTRDAVNAALKKLADDFGADGKAEAKAIIVEVGGVEKMAEIPEDKFEEVLSEANLAYDKFKDSKDSDDI